MTEKLTPKQERFVEEYLVDLNATQAAIRTGYSEKTAAEQASRLLTNVKIQTAIAAGRQRLADKAGISQERVLKEYARLAFLDIRKAFDEDGNLKPIHELDDDTAAAIAGLEVEVRRVAGDSTEELEDQAHGGSLKRQRGELTARLHKIKLSDKKGALDSIARHLGMFVDKTEITGKDGGPVVIQSKEQRDAAVAAALAADS